MSEEEKKEDNIAEVDEQDLNTAAVAAGNGEEDAAAENGEEVEYDPRNHPAGYDTLVLEDLRALVSDMESVGVNEGPRLQGFLERLPPSNDASSMGKTKVRVLKALKTFKYLPTDFNNKKDSVARLNTANKILFKDAINRCCENNEHRVALIVEILKPHQDRIRALDPEARDVGAPLLGENTPSNRCALLAHLMVHAEAQPLWIQLQEGVDAAERPAGLDQITRPRTQILECLLALTEEWKQRYESPLDFERFSGANIGEAASRECGSLNPLEGSFASPTELSSLRTKMINEHDILVRNLDASGQNRPSGPGAIGYARRLECWESFIGSSGRSKRVDLFYCFVMWENQQLRWLSRQLPDEDVVDSHASGGGGNSGSSGKKETRTQRKKRELSEVLSSLNGPPDPKELNDARADLYRNKALEAKESTQQLKCSRLTQGIESPAFALLPEETQAAALKNFGDTLLDK